MTKGQIKSLAIEAIDASNRIRPIDEAVAQAIGASIQARGLINMISVRQTPRTNSWKLVTGGHRLRGLAIAGLQSLTVGEHVKILKVDADEAQLIEAEENLARNDLTVLERALTIAAYRQAWERKYGPVNGGDQMRKRAQLVDANFWPGEHPQPGDLTGVGSEIGSFSKWVADRLGLSRDSYRRLTTIARGIVAELAGHLHGGPAADNQSQLMVLARMAPERQRLIAHALELGRSLDEAISDTDPNTAGKARKPMWEKRRDAVTSNFRALDKSRKLEVLAELAEDAPEIFDEFLSMREDR